MPIELTPNGTYGARGPSGGPRVLVRAAMAIISTVFRLRGNRVISLTTIGSVTGHERSVDLIALPEGPNAWIVAASNGGAARHPAWCVNMARTPERIWVRDGGRRVRVEADNLNGTERNEAYGRLISIYQGYAGYEQRTDREIPVIRLSVVD